MSHAMIQKMTDTDFGKTAFGLHPIRKSHQQIERPPFECVALVLQGGGALGAFQAGVYQALAEANLVPDWVAGISIGAINAALIAGNPPEARVEKLRAFWELVTTPFLPNAAEQRFRGGDTVHGLFNQFAAWVALMRGAPNF